MSKPTQKKAGNRNALVHGFYSKDVLLPWESREDFEKMHADLKAEFRPQRRAEEETVLDLTFLLWDKQTVRRMRQVAVLKDPFTNDIVATDRKSWSGIRKKLRAAAKNERLLQLTMEESLAEFPAQVQRWRKEIEQTSDREQIKTLEAKISACINLTAEHVVPFLVTLQQGPNAEHAFDNAYAPDSMEKIVRLEAMLDARIAKVLARFVGLKEFKRTPAGAVGVIGPPKVLTDMGVRR